MAFTLDDIIIERIQMAVATDFDDQPLYVLTQLADATISISAESTDAVDKDGTLIKRFYRGKQGEFTANNAMLNLNIVAAASGSDKNVASDTNSIVMPKIAIVQAGSTLDLTGYVEGSVQVNALSTSGAMGQSYNAGTTASATTYVISAENVLTPPTDSTQTQYIVFYKRTVTSGVQVSNYADKFPGTVRLWIKALAVDPCTADTLRAVYIYLPSFQVSPEVEISTTTDAQLAYNGTLQVDYCSTAKELYSIYVAEDDEE